MLLCRNPKLFQYPSLDLSCWLAGLQPDLSLSPPSWNETYVFLWSQIYVHIRTASHRIGGKEQFRLLHIAMRIRVSKQAACSWGLGYVIGLSSPAKPDILKRSCSCKLLNPVTTAHWQNNRMFSLFQCEVNPCHTVAASSNITKSVANLSCPQFFTIKQLRSVAIYIA